MGLILWHNGDGYFLNIAIRPVRNIGVRIDQNWLQHLTGKLLEIACAV